MLKRAAIGLAGLAVAAVFATAASAHMWDGDHQDRRDYYRQNGWNCGMGSGWMSHSGYCCDDPAWGTSAGSYSANPLTRDAAQKIIDEFARKSFPGYRVEKVGKESYRGRSLYTASLTGNESRFEVQVDAVDGRVIGVYPIEE